MNPATLGRMAEQGKPSMSATEAQRVVDLVRELLQTRFKTNVALAAELKVTPSAVSQWISGKNKPSHSAAQALAKLAGVPYLSLLDGADASSSGERYANREQAIRQLLEVQEAAEDQLRAAADRHAVALDADEDPPVQWWVDGIRFHLREMRRRGTLPALGQRVIPEDEDPDAAAPLPKLPRRGGRRG